MRQVPAKQQASVRESAAVHYLIIGDGRLARHLRTYLSFLNLPHDQWCRSTQDARALTVLSERASHVLIAISDSAIDPFLVAHPDLLRRACVHFSGAFVHSSVASAHPLMTFGPELYSIEAYRSVPFVFERGRGSMATLLPGLPNASFELDPWQKPLYHALCSMSGNFTTLLWEKAFASFSRELGLPQAILHPFLMQTMRNLLDSALGESVLTGALARGDSRTIEKHLAALGADPYADVYRAFVEAYSKPSNVEPATFPMGGLP